MMRSRVIAFLLVVSMLLTGVSMSVVPVSAADESDITITIGSATGKPGEKVGVTVSIANNGPDAGNDPIGGINMYIVCPEGLEQVAYNKKNEIKNGPMIAEWMELTDYDMTKTTSNIGTNPFCLFLEAALSSYHMEGDGVIATFYYQIPEDAAAGEYPVVFSFNNEKDEFGGVTYSRVYKWTEGVTEDEEGEATNIEEITAINWVSGVITVEAAETEPTECTHEWSDWAYDASNMPTCTAAGQQIRTCAKCGETETEPVAALGHDWQGLIDEIPADCLNEGTIAYEPCGRCGQLRNANGDEISADDLTIPALGHDLGEFVPNGNATCETDGTKTATCSRCDYSETVTDEGSREAVEHSFREPVSNDDATCTADGTWTYTCEVCGETKVETEPGTATGHDWSGWFAGELSCTEDNKVGRICYTCGAEEYDIWPAEGHLFGDWYEYKAPTLEAEGEMRRDCQREGCDHYESEAIPALQHEYTAVYTDPTCEADGYTTYTCTKAECPHSYVVTDEGSALGHSWGDPVFNNDATCTEDGTETYTCERCGATETSVRLHSSLGHDMSGWEVVIPATCTVEGVKENQCSRCDYLLSETLPVVEHEFTEFVSDNNATCHTDGTKTAKCDYGCGETYTVADNDSMLPHTYGEWYTSKAPTLEADGEERRDCSGCDAYETRVIPALTHEYTAVYTDPTCTEDGYTTYTCSKVECPHSYVVTDEGTALGHDHQIVSAYDPTCEAAGEIKTKCSRCDDTEVSVAPALGHDLGEWIANGDATCTADGTKTAKCSRCDYTETVAHEGSALGHNYESVVTEPTCEAGGYTTHTCARCGHTYTDSETEALGHEYSVETVTKQPTCTADGEKTFACERCDKFVTEAIPALGHELGEWTSNGDATCEADGTKTAACTRCDHTETAADEGSALGHNYESVVTEPTCEAGGYTTHTCARCGHTYTDSETEALGHEYSVETVTKQPTCTAEGEKTFTCERCDKFVTEAIPALGHELGEWTSNGDATCTADGTKTAACTRCDHTETAADEGSALGHNYESVVTEPTCEAGGYTTHTCARCGHTYTDSETEALGHEYSVENVTKQPTCTADGEKTFTCERCDKFVTETIPALGHDYEVVTVEPTCEADGSKTSTCKLCGEKNVEVLPALGHSFTNYVSNGDATCTTDGTKTAACDRCDATNTSLDEGSALGHDLVIHEAVAPTCLAEGSIAYTECARCGLLWNGAGVEITLADTVIGKLAEMDGTTAVVSPETVQKQEDGSVIIDLTNAGTQVDKIVVSPENLEGVEGPVVIAGPDAMVYVSAESVAEAVNGLEMTVAEFTKDALEETELAALENFKFLQGVTVQTNTLVREGDQVAIRFELPKGHKMSNIRVYAFVDGELVELETEKPEGYLVFDAVEGGEYIVVSTRTNGSPDMGDSTNLVILLIALLASFAGMVVAIINRKKLSHK